MNASITWAQVTMIPDGSTQTRKLLGYPPPYAANPILDVFAGDLKLGNQATVGAKSGVMRDVPDGGTVLGMPAAPDKQAKRKMIAVKQLPESIRRMRELEKQVEQLSARIA
jgi:hypothetical protein